MFPKGVPKIPPPAGSNERLNDSHDSFENKF